MPIIMRTIDIIKKKNKLPWKVKSVGKANGWATL
jgi:hypothetical protein